MGKREKIIKDKYAEIIDALMAAIDGKDNHTGKHSAKVSSLSEILARKLRLPSAKVETIRIASKLHDLGKVAVEDFILQKPGRLTQDEWNIIRRHPVIGADIIESVTSLKSVARLVRQDHERWDGKGYPDGLKGDEIDIGARIIFAADAYDAMLADRPYKKAKSKDEAIKELRRNSGTQFDPKVVDVFLDIAAELLPR